MPSNSGIFTKAEFQNRGIIKLAPDMLAYFGGSQTMQIVAPVSNATSKISFNDGITTINVQNNVDPPGSSTASIEIATPIYNETSNYWVNYYNKNTDSIIRAPVFSPMTEVTIYMKGRYLVDGVPRYYPVFWGFITEVDESYSGGMYKITLNCANILSWLGHSLLNVHPNLESIIYSGGHQPSTVNATIFDKANPYTIVYNMINTFFAMSGTGKSDPTLNFVTPVSIAQRTSTEYQYPSNQFRKIAGSLSNYWKERFGSLGALLKMYGMGGNEIKTHLNPKTKLIELLPSTIRASSLESDSQKAKGAVQRSQFDVDKSLRNFIALADYEKMGNFESSEYQSKLEILTEIKNRMGYEFYQDVNGNFIFKPPFYNMDVKGVFPYTIAPNEIISSSFQKNSDGIVTTVLIHTAFTQDLKNTPHARGEGFHMDFELAQQYGIRSADITLTWTTDSHIARSLAVGQMDIINAKTSTGNITVPGRPEMKLGYPIYLIHRDTYHYVKSISHSFDYGGSCTTTLSLETERRPVMIIDQNSGTWSDVLKNKSYIFSAKLTDKQLSDFGKNEGDSKLQELERASGLSTSMNPGLYKIGNSLPGAFFPTNTTIPYTDENGYKLIGGFPYGRNVDPLTGDVRVTQQDNVAQINPIAGSDGESKAMSSLFTEKEGAILNYLQSARINQNPNDTLDLSPVGIKPKEIPLEAISTNLVASAYSKGN